MHRRFKETICGFLLVVGSFPQPILSKTLTLINSNEEVLEFKMDGSERFEDVLDIIQEHCQTDILKFEAELENESLGLIGEQIAMNEASVDVTISNAGVTVKAKKLQERDFHVSVTKQEKKDITYIITTLAREDLITIGLSTSSLEKAGDRISTIHPLRFLMTIFSNEELKAGIHAIREKGGWVWDGFSSKLYKSLSDEAGRHNMKSEYYPEFAKTIGIDLALISSLMNQGKWKEFVNTLIDKIPRQNDPNRYNM